MSATDIASVRRAMESAVGAANVGTDVSSYSVDGIRPKAAVLPATVQELSQVMAAAWEGDLAVTPWAGGTRMELGNILRRLDVVTDLTRLDRILQHNPGDLTVTVEAGVTLASLQKTLAAHGQFLALDPPLPARATIGGTLATGASGPLKWRYGHPRDLVIGMKVVQADGKITKSGGQVVKNVSGYDMARLHVGGLGTLGIIAEVSFKLSPWPHQERTLLASFQASGPCLEAGLKVFQSYVMPLALTSFDRAAAGRMAAPDLKGNCFLAARFGGRPLTLERQVNEVAAVCRARGATAVETLEVTQASTLWRGIADFGWSRPSLPVVGGRVAILPSRVPGLVKALEQLEGGVELYPAVISHPGYGTVLVSWFAGGDGIAYSSLKGFLDLARGMVHSLGGLMTIERCPREAKAEVDVWDEVGESLGIMRRMKEQYDSRGILNPGRFVGRI